MLETFNTEVLTYD